MNESTTVVTNRVTEIIELHGEIVNYLKQSLDKAIRIGALLADQKALMPHGAFIPWVEKNLPFTDRTARNYMRLHRERDRIKTETISDLKTAYALLASPKPTIDIVEHLLGTLVDVLRDDGHDLDSLPAGWIQAAHSICVSNWLLLAMDGRRDDIAKLMETARAAHPGSKIVNDWHTGPVVCNCPKCKGARSADYSRWIGDPMYHEVVRSIASILPITEWSGVRVL